jgi:hypothetical protein
MECSIWRHSIHGIHGIRGITASWRRHGLHGIWRLRWHTIRGNPQHAGGALRHSSVATPLASWPAQLHNATVTTASSVALQR